MRSQAALGVCLQGGEAHVQWRAGHAAGVGAAAAAAASIHSRRDYGSAPTNTMTKRAERALWEATRAGAQQCTGNTAQGPAQPPQQPPCDGPQLLQPAAADPRQAAAAGSSLLSAAGGGGVRAAQPAAAADGGSAGAGLPSKRRRLSPEARDGCQLLGGGDDWAAAVPASPTQAQAALLSEEPAAVDNSLGTAERDGRPGGAKCVLSDDRVICHADVDSFYCQAGPAPRARPAAARQRPGTSSTSPAPAVCRGVCAHGCRVCRWSAWTIPALWASPWQSRSSTRAALWPARMRCWPSAVAPGLPAHHLPWAACFMWWPTCGMNPDRAAEASQALAGSRRTRRLPLWSRCPTLVSSSAATPAPALGGTHRSGVRAQARAAGVRCGDGVGAAGRAHIKHLIDMGAVSLEQALQRCPTLQVRPMRTDRYRQVCWPQHGLPSCPHAACSCTAARPCLPVRVLPARPAHVAGCVRAPAIL